MSAPNFGDLLKAKSGTVERPKNFPIGHYLGIITGHEFGSSSKKETPYVRFQVKLLGPQEDVVMDDFEEAGGLAELSNRKSIKLDFYITPDALYRLDEFLTKTLGLEEGPAIDENIPNTTNMELLVEIQHDPGKKEGEFYMNIADYAAVE